MSAQPVYDLFTIGHSTQPIERFVALLHAAGANSIVDVRSVPFSRRSPWFSRARLEEQLRRDRISYLALGHALGGRPRDPSLYRDGIADYQAMAATPHFQEALDTVLAQSRTLRPCLMCAEREPLDCHRCLLVGRALAARGVAIGHILADGSIEPHAQTEERLIVLAGKKADLFADPAARLDEAYRRRNRAVAARLKP
jgi:uncharacterized protein (DUF488 family)